MRLGRPSLRNEDAPGSDPGGDADAPGDGKANGSYGTPKPAAVPTSCPPGYTPSTTPGATPGSCTNAQGNVVSPQAFALAQSVDSRYSPAQWQAWINLGAFDPARYATGQPAFRSERTGPNGETLDAWVDKPVDCPQGMTAFGDSKCLDEGDPRLSGAAAAPPPPPPPPPPLDQGKAQLEYTGDPLQDALYQYFNQRAGIFGKRNPYLLGASLRTGTEDLAAKPLGGGGVWWGDAGSLSSALAPFTDKPVPPPNPFPVPKAAAVRARDFATPPKVDTEVGPLASALLTSPSFGVTTQKRPRARSPLEQALLGTGA